MPTLVLNLPNFLPRGLALTGRVVIGRRPFNDILIPDPNVSRIHAWIGQRDGRHVLFDAGSRSGTLINGQRVTAPHVLVDGDEIDIGPGKLTFLETDALPQDILPLEPPPPPPASDPYDGGIYFDCPCGGPMWVSAELAGAAGRCRYCGQQLIVPAKSGQLARPIAPAGSVESAPRQLHAPRRIEVNHHASRPLTPSDQARGGASTALDEAAGGPSRVCSICQSEIAPGEAQTSCPSCHLTFHRQCWEENYGCSAYGCDQVNILAKDADLAQEMHSPDDAQAGSVAPIPHRSNFPWDAFLLALSFVAMGLGALAFGVPSIAMLIWTAAFILQRKSQRPAIALTAMVVSIIGMAAGLVTSLFWWKGLRVWETFLK